MDITEGPQTVTWQMTVRAHRTTQAGDPRPPIDGHTYGVFSDLQALFAVKNPRATPSNLIIFTDHLGADHNVYLTGDFPYENITPYVDGTDSLYFVPLVMEEA